jgi:spermidine/putrescine transport system ATP-binding protein
MYLLLTLRLNYPIIRYPNKLVIFYTKVGLLMKKTDTKIIEVRNVTKIYHNETVVNDISLSIKAGDFVTLLGPSGCGKTTILRMLAGFEAPSSGQIFLEGKDVTNIPPYKRNINTVFQRYALFPHLNVFNNIAFGLKLKKLPKEEIVSKVNKALKLVDLEDYGHRDIDTLSGGQQQRIAIARAIVNEPKVLLLDEPLSALDLKMRKEMQIELRRLHKELGITFIFVTHDQEEAMTMSDTIVVLRDGVIQQTGKPKQIYYEPKNAYVADFIGESNIIPGKMLKDFSVQFLGHIFTCVDKGFDPNESVDIVIRPEDIEIVKSRPQIKAKILSAIFKGTFYDITANVNDYELSVKSTKNYEVGDDVGLAIEPESIHVMERDLIINELKTEITGENTVAIGGEDFEFITAEEYQKGDKVTAKIEFGKIELTDDEEDAAIGGTISSTIYKGTFYEVRVRLDNDTALTVDTPYEWDEEDRVGIKIDPKDIKVTRR